MAISVITTTSAIATGVRDEGASARATAAHSKTVAADPQLPGPGRSLPIPKNVATSVAHSGVDSSVFTILRPDLQACSLESARLHP